MSGNVTFQFVNFFVQEIILPEPNVNYAGRVSYNIDSGVNKAVAQVASIPNIGLLLKIGPFLNMLDDLSYFVYHNAIYDDCFSYVCNLSWNWANAKWIPP